MSPKAIALQWSRADGRLRAAAILSALVLAFAAQYLFTGEVFTRNRDSNVWTWEPRFTAASRLLLAALACGGLATLLSRTGSPPVQAPTESAAAGVQPAAGPGPGALYWAAGCYGISLALYLLVGEIETVRILWLLGVAALVGPLWIRWRASPDSEAVARWEWALVAAITAIGFGLRYWRLTEIPSHVDNDVALMGQHALKLIRSSNYNWFGYSSSEHLLSYDQALAWSMRLFGQNHYGLVMSSVIAGSLTLPLVFLLGRRMFGRRVGLIAMALLAISYVHVHFSRTLFGPLPTFFVVAVFYFLFRGLHTRQGLWFALAGVALGWGLLLYDSSRVIPVIATALFGWRLLWQPRVLWANRRNWAIFGLGALLGFGPMLGFAALHLDQFIGRGNTVALWEPGVLAHAQTSYQVASFGQVLLEQTKRTLLAFHLYGDGSPHFAFPRPMTSAPAAALLVLGLGCCLLRLRDARHFILVAWVALTFMLGGVLTYDPPYWPHLNVTLPAVFLIAALGADKVVEVLAPPARPGLVAAHLAVAGALVSTGIHNWDVYYNYVRDNAGPRIRAARFINSLPPGYQVYLLSDIFTWDEYAFRFFADGVVGVDVTAEALRAEPPRLERPSVFILYDHHELAPLLATYYPGGEMMQHKNNEGQLIFITYVVRPDGPAVSAGRGQPANPFHHPGWWLLSGALALLAGRAGAALWPRRSPRRPT